MPSNVLEIKGLSIDPRLRGRDPVSEFTRFVNRRHNGVHINFVLGAWDVRVVVGACEGSFKFSMGVEREISEGTQYPAKAVGGEG